MPKLFKAQKPKTDTEAAAKKPEGKSKTQYGLFLYNNVCSKSDPQKPWQLFYKDMGLSSYNDMCPCYEYQSYSLIVAPMNIVEQNEVLRDFGFTEKVDELNLLGVYSLFVASEIRTRGTLTNYKITFNPEFTGFFDYMIDVPKDSPEFLNKIVNMLMPAEYTRDTNTPIESWNKLEKLIIKYNQYVDSVAQQVKVHLPELLPKDDVSTNIVAEYLQSTISYKP